MLRFATIGTSSIVDLFGRGVAAVPGVEWSVVHSRDLERGRAFAAEHGVGRSVGSVDAVATAADVDAVYIASPNALHHRQALTLLQAGKHVLVEKSACATAAEWRELEDAADASGVVLLESIRSVFDPTWRSIASYRESLEPVRQVHLHMAQRSRRYDNFLAGRVENIFKPEMAAGALMDLGVYCLHPLVALFGAPGRVSASSVLLRNGIDGATTLMLDYPGFTATVACSKVSADRTPSMIAGEDQTLVIDQIADPHVLRMDYARDGESEVLEVAKPLPQQAYVLQAFARMVDDVSLALPHRRTTALVLAICDEARRQVGLRFPADED